MGGFMLQTQKRMKLKEEHVGDDASQNGKKDSKSDTSKSSSGQVWI